MINKLNLMDKIKMSISLCIIVKDEEKLIKNCLNSVKNIYDEIIVIDTGSKDKTINIAKKFGAEIYEFEWNDNFSDARNFSLQKATKDWILIMDADETMSKNDCVKIKNLTNNKDEFMGYSFIQRTYTNTKKSLKFNYATNDFYDESFPFLGWTHRGITRLFRNDNRIRFTYPVHETIIESIKNINGKIKQTNIPIHHFEALKGKLFNKKKSLYYIKLLKNKIIKYPKAKFYIEIALELNKLSDKKAIFYFNKAIELNPFFKELIINRL